MTDKLTFWCAVAAVATAVVAVAVTGVAVTAGLFAFGLALAVVVACVGPALLAGMLLVRWAWLRFRGRPTALLVGGRPRLEGTSGLLWPAAILLAWCAVRETGAFDARLCATSRSWTATTMRLAWEDGGGSEPRPRLGLTVDAPTGPLGDAFREQLANVVHRSPEWRHDTATLVCDPPFGAMPLYKDEQVTAKATAVLLLCGGRAGTVGRTSKVEVAVEGRWAAVGLLSRRAFQRWIGDELGEALRTAIDEHHRKAFAH